MCLNPDKVKSFSSSHPNPPAPTTRTFMFSRTKESNDGSGEKPSPSPSKSSTSVKIPEPARAQSGSTSAHRSVGFLQKNRSPSFSSFTSSKFPSESSSFRSSIIISKAFVCGEYLTRKIALYYALIFSNYIWHLSNYTRCCYYSKATKKRASSSVTAFRSEFVVVGSSDFLSFARESESALPLRASL